MKTIMLLITVLAVVSAALNSNDAVARLKTISKRDVRDSMEQGNTEQERTRESFDKDLGKLLEHLKTVKEELSELCEPGKPASPWCEYKTSLDTSKGSSLDERQNKRMLSSRCFPGIPFCKKIRIPETAHAQFQRCGPGAAHCLNGKRTLAEARSRQAPHCPSGWPWCLN